MKAQIQALKNFALWNFIMIFIGIAACWANHARPEPHRCLPPTRLNIQKHWVEVHDPDHKIANTLDSKMLDICSRECMPKYWEDMEEN